MSITHYPSAKCSVHSIDHYALDVPDLALAQIFFEAFGLLVERREPGLRLRTAHSDHVWASILQGNAKQLSYLCFNCRVGELDRIHDQALGAGGKKAPPPPLALHSDGFWFHDPDGNLIQVRVGPKTMPDASSIGQVPPRANHDRGVLSRSAAKKIYPTRLSHVLLYSADVEGQIGFYTRSIGLGLSDKAQDLIAFMHGRHGSDHHLLAFAKSHTRGWHHASWDVPGIEEVGLGWMQMQRAGFDRVWGPGRHVLGSNYFCYVRDPWGSYCEYSSDIDYVPEGHVWPSGDFQQEDSIWNGKRVNTFKTAHVVRHLGSPAVAGHSAPSAKSPALARALASGPRQPVTYGAVLNWCLTFGLCTVVFRTRRAAMTTAAARLDLRLNPADKARITRAADLRGVPLSAFVRDAVLREAESVMAAELTVTLSAEESRRFLKALDAPFQPNAKLKKALARAGQA